MKKKYTLVLLFCLMQTIFFSQSPRIFTNNSAVWIAYNGDHKVSDKWGVHLEYQMRRAEFINIPQQDFVRVGINYHLLPTLFVTAGYAFAYTHPYGEFSPKIDFPENRTYQQLQMNQLYGKLEAVTRLRLEQRWVNSPVTQNNELLVGDAIYTNRFRISEKFCLPFSGSVIKDLSLYAFLQDEMFINFGDKVKYNVFDQNRLYTGLGYKIPKVGRLELSYLLQRQFRGDGIKTENNNTLSVSLNSNINFYRKKS